MAKYGRGLDVLHDVAPDEAEAEVIVECACGEEYTFEMGDLLDIHSEGWLECALCGAGLDIRSTLEMAWEV
jgi:hypothetical protein